MPTRDEIPGEPQPQSLALPDRLEASPVTDQRAAGIPRAAINVAEAAVSLGVGEAAVRDLCHQRSLPSFRIGRRVLIPHEKFLAWVDEQADAGSGVAASAYGDRE